MALRNTPHGVQGAQSPVALLKEKVPSAIAALTKQLKQKSIKTRIGAFTVLRELVTVLGGGLSDQVPLLFFFSFRFLEFASGIV